MGPSAVKSFLRDSPLRPPQVQRSLPQPRSLLPTLVKLLATRRIFSELKITFFYNYIELFAVLIRLGHGERWPRGAPGHSAPHSSGKLAVSEEMFCGAFVPLAVFIKELKPFMLFQPCFAPQLVVARSSGGWVPGVCNYQATRVTQVI